MPDERKKVLVVDDNSTTLNVITFNLKRDDLDVEVALDPRTALELMSRQQFDLIITDYKMPEMNGEEFIRSIRQDNRYAHTPILMCTAKAYEFDAKQLMKELAISRFLMKPFSPSEVVDAVHDILQFESGK